MTTPVAPVIIEPNLTGYAWSGTTQVSGPAASGDPSGPASVEEQDLTIWGARVPFGQLVDSSVTLSAVTVSEKVTGSYLFIIVKASYSQRKVYGSWRQINYHQNQTFEFQSQKYDAQGNEYGDLTPSTLGPQFSIISKTPWYSREPWDDTRHQEISPSTITCASWAAIKNPSLAASETIDPRPYMHDFQRTLIKSHRAGSLIGDNMVHLENGWHYWIPGEYGVVKEDLRSIISMIDDIGTELASNDFYALPKANVGYQQGQGTINVIKDTGLQTYDKSRHDYSTI